MDEYTGLLIDQLVQHRWSRVIIAGRNAVDANLLQACAAVAEQPNFPQTRALVEEAAATWVTRITLPPEQRPLRKEYIRPLVRLIQDRKVLFYEPLEQGANFNLNLDDLLASVGPRTFGNQTQAVLGQLRQELEPLLGQTRQTEGEQRDNFLNPMAYAVQRKVVQATANRHQLQGNRYHDSRVSGRAWHFGTKGFHERQWLGGTAQLSAGECHRAI